MKIFTPSAGCKGCRVLGNTFATYLSIQLGLILSVTATLSGQDPLAPAQGFQIFTRNGVELSGGNCDGPIAAGGDLTMNGTYSVAMNDPGGFTASGDARPTGLLIGGRVYYSGGSGADLLQQTYVHIGNMSGSYAYSIHPQNGSSVNTRVVGVSGNYDANPRINLQLMQPQASVNRSGLIDFASAFGTLSSNSSCLSGKTQNVTASGSGNISLTLQANQVNYWNLTGSQLNAITQITFNNQPNASTPLVINVNASGAFAWNTPNFSGIGDQQGHYIIINFYNASSLTINGNNTVIGSILAPGAAVIKNTSGNIDGQLIASSFDQNGGEVHYRTFDGSINCSATVCNNITNGGTIGSSQTIASGGDPAAFTSSAAPSGGSGTLEIIWVKATTGCPNPAETDWQQIPGATGMTYDPPAGLTQTTCYRRCSRRAGCTEYDGESNVVTVTVTCSVTASVAGTNTICVGQNTTLTASGGTSYSWNTGATTAAITVNPTATTTYTVTATAAGGCTGTATRTVTVNQIDFATSTTAATCASCYNGCLTVDVNNCPCGTFSYTWNNGTTSGSGTSSTEPFTICNLPPGTYSLTVSTSCGGTPRVRTGTSVGNSNTGPAATCTCTQSADQPQL
jgi:choice-of-anchor A domain-containing protein